MDNYWKIFSQAFSLVQPKNSLLIKTAPFISLFLLAPGIAFSSVNQIPKPNSQQEITIRSFHETTELAENLWSDLTSSFVSFYEKGDYQRALSTAQKAYEVANNNFGIEDVNTADALLKLGIINQTLGNLNEAEDYLLGSLVILEEQLSPDHPDVAVAMTNLGNVYFEMKRPLESEKYHKLALKIRTNAFGKSHPTVAQSNYNLAVLYENEMKYDKAVTFYQNAISSWSASLGPTHPYIGSALNNLSNVYIKQGNNEKAVEVLQRTVSFKKSVYGAQHEEVAQSLISLGTTYLKQGEYNPAKNAYEEALDIARHILQASDPQLAVLMYTLANIYHTQAQIEGKNITNKQEAASTSTYQMDTTNSQPVLTMTANKKGLSLFEQALPLYEKAAEILDDGESATHPVLNVVLTELALLYKEIGKADMASATESRITTH